MISSNEDEGLVWQDHGTLAFVDPLFAQEVLVFRDLRQSGHDRAGPPAVDGVGAVAVTSSRSDRTSSRS